MALNLKRVATRTYKAWRWSGIKQGQAQSETHSPGPQPRKQDYTYDPMYFYCCVSFADGDPTLKRHRVNVSCSLWANETSQRPRTFGLRWFEVRPPYAALHQQYLNIGLSWGSGQRLVQRMRTPPLDLGHVSAYSSPDLLTTLQVFIWY